VSREASRRDRSLAEALLRDLGILRGAPRSQSDFERRLWRFIDMLISSYWTQALQTKFRRTVNNQSCKFGSLSCLAAGPGTRVKDADDRRPGDATCLSRL